MYNVNMKQLTVDDAVVYVSVRMPASMKNRIMEMAEDNDISINRQVVELIDLSLRNS